MTVDELTMLLRATCLITAVIVGATQCDAAGAIAEGIAPGGAQLGYSIGIATNQPDEVAAKKAAVTECKKYGDAQSQAACHAVATFSNQCATSVEDPKA